VDDAHDVRPTARRTGREGGGATVSVVVATHNRAARLQNLISGLRSQSLPPAEVVIVDDGSTDRTLEVLANEENRGGLPLRVIRLGRSRGPASARDAGWRAARGELIAFTDDDCVPASGWLEAGQRASAGGRDIFVQGRTEPDPRTLDQIGPFSRTLTVTSLDASFPTCNMFFPRRLLEQIGGFDIETFGRAPGGEDCDLAWRAIDAGWQPLFADDAVVHHAIDRLGAIGTLKVAARWTTPMAAYARHDELRRVAFTHRIFWKRIHYLFVRAIVGFLLPTRWGLVRNWLMYPYLQDVWARGRLEGGGPLLAPYFILHDAIEVAAVARAAVRTRKLML
jgi:glycosyltransferase involved in cell wall biosynthesis